MNSWKYSYQVTYSNAELKTELANITEVKKTGAFDILPEGVYFKRTQAKEFLAFKGGQNISSWVYAKVKHSGKEGQNSIDVQIGFTDIVLWPLVFMMAIPIVLCYAWIVPGFIDKTGLVFFTIAFLFGASFLTIYLRWHLKSFEKDLHSFFTQLTLK